jgi:hypothetical protein
LIHSQNHSSPLFILPLMDIYCKLILVSLYLLLKQGDPDKHRVDGVINHAWQLSRTLSIFCPSYSFLLKALRSLQSMGILTDSNPLSLQAIHEEDIHKAYGSDPLFSRFMV